MGANEVIDNAIPPVEFSFRLMRQLQRKKKADRLRDTLKDGLLMAVTGPLSGLLNRRYAFPHMARIAKRSNASGSPFAVMVLDLDRFKRINDGFGHGAGDQVQKEIANRLKANVRSVDLIARIGGEEFLVVMPDTGIDAARIAAERLRGVTEAGKINIAASPFRCQSPPASVSQFVALVGRWKPQSKRWLNGPTWPCLAPNQPIEIKSCSKNPPPDLIMTGTAPQESL